MKKSTMALLAVLGAGILILVVFFGKVIVHPNSYLFSTSGDAVKSYYNFSYYLKYDSGIDHNGINYPYGDHLQYINSHPIHLQLIKFLDKNIYPLADHGAGILNLGMILSLLLALPFIYLVLRKFSLPPWYAAVVSLIILFLSPQVDRLGGHFEMVYAFFIPLYWYLLIRWQEAPRKIYWSLLLLVTALAGGFTSAYFAALLAIFPMAIVLVQLWNHRRVLKQYLPEGLHLLILALLPLIIIKGYVNLTDWVDDRPDNPWGFFIFHANVFSIFLPPNSVLKEVLSPIVDLSYKWEGRAYVGLPATLLALSFLLIAILNIFSRTRPGWKTYFPNKKLNLYLAASFIVLIFSMCIPFNWGLRFLTELLPPLKQFRCLGRFSWIFYYVFTVFTATYLYYLYRLIRKKGYRLQAKTALLLILAFWGLEAMSRIQKSTSRIFNKNEILKAETLDIVAILEESGKGAHEFQGIFFLPFANTSGDKLKFERGLDAFTEAMRCSYQTGIPIIQSFSPRLSLSQAMSSIQLLADSTIYKQRVDDMNQKPLLLVFTSQELNPQESALLSRAELLWTGNKLSLALLPVQAFNQGFDAWKELAGSLLDSLGDKGMHYIGADPEQVIYQDFEELSSERAFTGSGSLDLKKGSLELFNQNLHECCSDEEVELSFWLYVDHRTNNMPGPVLWLWDENDKLIHKEKLNSREVHNVDGLWVRISKNLIPEPGVRYQLTVAGKYITVDDLLLKPASARILVRHENGDYLFDNYRVPVVTER
ncbi:MAG: hypothetical protein KAI08_04300 [Bacteroidales bacterium]|nr:hypothetical protein [Bacteroidales bacterium]